MRNRKVSLLSGLGICLILISFLLMLGMQLSLHFGARNRQMVISQLNEMLPERIQGTPGIQANNSMPVLEINGADYCCILEIPEFGITLPVSDQWDRKNLYSTPSRFCGSVCDGTLVIGGGDYSQQFTFCDEIEHGTLITVTDMTGAQFSYRVSNIERAEHATPQWLQDPDCDVVLFCRDADSFEYIAVKCVSSYDA